MQELGPGASHGLYRGTLVPAALAIMPTIQWIVSRRLPCEFGPKIIVADYFCGIWAAGLLPLAAIGVIAKELPGSILSGRSAGSQATAGSAPFLPFDIADH